MCHTGHGCMDLLGLFRDITIRSQIHTAWDGEEPDLHSYHTASKTYRDQTSRPYEWLVYLQGLVINTTGQGLT